MADGFVQLPDDTANTGKKEDHYVIANGNYREAVVIGDPSVVAAVAPVDATKGLGVNLIDGANVVEGATTDVAVVGDNSGTVSAKLRGLNKIFNDVWDSVNHWLKVQASNFPTTVDTNSGNKSASTLRVVIATDQPQLTNKLLVTPDANSAVNVAQINGVTPLMGAGNTGTGSPRVTIASDQAVIPVGGNIAHDGADSGNPVKVGYKALSYGTNPTGVSSGDRTDAYANVAGVPFILGGHPNIITRRDNYTGAQTDTAIVTVAGGTKIVIVSCTVAADAANTAKPAVRVGFGTASTPTGASTYLSHPGIPAGGGIREAGAVAGADGEDIRITCAAPTGGSIDVVTKYFTIES